MSLNAASMDDAISKAEFARRRGVSPGRVSQWISEKKISGDAFDGEGRNAKIREAIALAQLNRNLDPMQMTANGLSTQLKPLPPSPSSTVLPFAAPAAPGAPPPTEPLVDSVEDKIKRGRLEQIERQNREGKRQEAVDAGRLTDAGAAKAHAARETARLITMFEGSLSEFATAISAEFKLPQRDVLHLLRGEFRKMRADVAGEIKNRAETLPAIVELDLDAATDQEDPETD